MDKDLGTQIWKDETTWKSIDGRVISKWYRRTRVWRCGGIFRLRIASSGRRLWVLESWCSSRQGVAWPNERTASDVALVHDWRRLLTRAGVSLWPAGYRVPRPSAVMIDVTAGQFVQISQLCLKERENKKSSVFLPKFLALLAACLLVCKHQSHPLFRSVALCQQLYLLLHHSFSFLCFPEVSECLLFCATLCTRVACRCGETGRWRRARLDTRHF